MIETNVGSRYFLQMACIASFDNVRTSSVRFHRIVGDNSIVLIGSIIAARLLKQPDKGRNQQTEKQKLLGEQSVGR